MISLENLEGEKFTTATCSYMYVCIMYTIVHYACASVLLVLLIYCIL